MTVAHVLSEGREIAPGMECPLVFTSVLEVVFQDSLPPPATRWSARVSVYNRDRYLLCHPCVSYGSLNTQDQLLIELEYDSC